MIVAITLLSITGLPYLYALFIAVVLSYLLSVIYLRKVIAVAVNNEEKLVSDKGSLWDLSKKFIKYGAPLSVWFAFAYLTSYIDKLFMAKNIGMETQGNYQAIFDFLSRSLALIISPVTTSLFPILTLAFQKNEIVEMSKLIKKIVLYELAAFLLVSILYWLLGASILFYLLKIPSTGTYKLIGLIVIAGTFVWQISMVLQKRFELRLLSFLLLVMIAIAIAIQILVYLVFQKENNVLLYPIGYLISGLIYLILVSYPIGRKAKNKLQYN
jgi:O-antigen/teichoic acid export membrane protein